MPFSIDLVHLPTRRIIVKISGVAKPVSCEVKRIEPAVGLWLMGGGILGRLAEQGLPAEAVANPAVFVPMTSIEWLMAQSEL